MIGGGGSQETGDRMQENCPLHGICTVAPGKILRTLLEREREGDLEREFRILSPVFSLSPIESNQRTSLIDTAMSVS
jgi:hypothetical protein